MSVQSVKDLFRDLRIEDRLLYSEITSDTVEHAAEMIGCEPRQIAKTMSFLADGQAIVIVSAGDAKIDNAKYKSVFHTKAKMIPPEEVESYTEHLPGGVCPFALKDGVGVWLDISLRRFDVVYAGAGDDHHTAAVTIPLLEELSRPVAWVDVCKGWAPEETL